MTTYPKAERLAETMPLPVVSDPLVKELYGYSVAVLDESAAIAALCQAGYRADSEAAEVFLGILESRVDNLNHRMGINPR